MLVAVLGVGELIVGDRHFRGGTVRREIDGDESVSHGASFPSPGVDEFPRRVDESIGAENGVEGAAFVGDDDTVLAADAEVDAGLSGVVV